MKVVILSGVSGSGKTTFATERLESEGNRPSAIVSADHYFMGKDGYQFDASKLSEAHGYCFREFIQAMRDDVRTIFVDNTNTTNEEIAPYYLGAQAFFYDVQIITLDVKLPIGFGHVENFAKRNAHGVDANAIWQQMNRLARRVLLPWWKNTIVPVKL